MTVRKKTGEFNRASWLRALVIQNPEIKTTEELLKEYDKGKCPKNLRPKATDQKILSQAKRQVCQRWGVDKIEDLPRRDGQIKISGMIRLYLEQYGPEVTEKDAQPDFDADGIKLKDNQFASVKSTWLKQQSADGGEPVSGQRARFVADKGRKPGAKNKRKKKNDLFADLITLRNLTTELGGIDNVRAVVEAIDELGDINTVRQGLDALVELQETPK